ncbi:MAG: AAA family ATPase, partial [Deltaproteobacteria bacterium]|nr:AAA family ATPase [Deltaproteobacteria bacterium]
MAKKPKDVEEVEVEQVNGAETAEEDKTIVVADIVLPPSLAVIPLFDRPLLPKMMAPIVLGNNAESRALLDAVDGASKYVGLILVREQKEDTAHMAMMQRKPPEKIEEFHKVGVIAKVLQVSGKDGKFIHLMVHVLDRFEIQKVLSIKPFIRVNVEYKKDEQGKVTDELKAYAISVINIIKELVNLNPLFKEQLSMLIGQVDVNQPGMLADLSASMTTTSGQELQRILELIDVPKRIEEVLVLLKNEVEISKLQAKINKQIEERLSTQQREFFLKQQLQEIKKELGLTKGDNETEFEKFEKRLKGLKLTSDEVKARIDEEMEKLKVLERSSPEFNVTRAYLDWLTVLPWGVYTKDNKDINKAAKILNKDHYGLQDVKDRILETISVGVLKGDLAGSIILLVGAPGVGKTSIGQSIARSLGRKFYRFSLGGMRDEAEIKGHRRTYIGALPGKFIHAIKTCNSSNPVIM